MQRAPCKLVWLFFCIYCIWLSTQAILDFASHACAWQHYKPVPKPGHNGASGSKGGGTGRRGGRGIWPAARWMLGTVVPCRKVFLSRAREEPDWLPVAAGAASPGRTSASAEGGAARGCSEWASRVLGPWGPGRCGQGRSLSESSASSWGCRVERPGGGEPAF